MCFHRGFPGLFCFLLGLLLVGCAQETPPAASDPSPAAPDDSAFQLVTAMTTDALKQAFEQRADYPYVRRSSTAQIDPQTGRRTAFYQETVRYRPEHSGEQAFERVAVDSAGAFDMGLLDGMFAQTQQPQMLQNPAPYLLPEKPTYSSARGPQLYEYNLLPDTTLAGRAAAVVQIRLKTKVGNDQQIRSARFYIDRSSHQLVAIRLHRRQNALLFKEKTTLQARIHPRPNNKWFPDFTRYVTTLELPFTSPQRLRGEARYFSELPTG